MGINRCESDHMDALMTEELAQTWDEIFNHLDWYDFSRIEQVKVDTIQLPDAPTCPAVHYGGTIIIDPRVFTYSAFKSDYTGIQVTERVLLFILLHEVYHYLAGSGQAPRYLSPDGTTSMKEERAADNFALKHYKEIINAV